MLVHIYGAKCVGIDAVGVTVEMDIRLGIGIHLVGLADAAVRESIMRTTNALESRGFRIPGKKIVINLAPADLHKSGSGYDLPIAVGIIAASGQSVFPNLKDYLIMGELGLDGSIRDINGALPFAEYAAEHGFKACIFPKGSAQEAVELEGIDVYGAERIDEVVRILEEKEDPSDLLAINQRELFLERTKMGLGEESYPDFCEIIGQDGAKRGAEIATAGGHNLIFIGPPGSGKSSLAKAIAGILPPMNKAESLVTSKIYSIAGISNLRYGLMRCRPFRAPHYSASVAAMIGGGGGDGIIPGEVSLAHGGVLFADEFAQMPKGVMESLRGPLEDRKVVISRLRSKVEYPASFMLVAASNPCPCGYWGDGDRCTCSVGQRQGYLERLSGPILDRVDIHIWMKPVSSRQLFSAGKGETSADVSKRVVAAREIQRQRFRGEPISCNAEMSSKQIEKYCPLSEECRTTLESIMDKMDLSMRACTRIIKVARTIADLANQSDIMPEHILEAASFRFLDKRTL